MVLVVGAKKCNRSFGFFKCARPSQKAEREPRESELGAMKRAIFLHVERAKSTRISITHKE